MTAQFIGTPDSDKFLHLLYSSYLLISQRNLF